MLHPVRAWKAWQERRTARLLQRYAAAQINHLTGGWRPPVKDVNELAGDVEYDSGTGSIVAFHLEDDGYGKSRRIPADQVVFGFHRQRPGQLRGITPFAAATMIAQDAIGEELSSMGNKRSVRATFRIATQAF